ncbi:MAG: hypothetical protein L0G96_18750, partial [Acinetobacter sp.]|nr:hypothetical protein [Acinetobacter sp.]
AWVLKHFGAKTMIEVTFTFRADESLKKEFSSFTKDMDRSRAQLLRNFIKQQLEVVSYGAWFQKQVQIGLDQANAGNLILHEDVKAKFAAKRAATLARLATNKK